MLQFLGALRNIFGTPDPKILLDELDRALRN